MANIREAVTAHLKAHAGLIALIGGASARVYWKQLPQAATYPAVTFFMVDNDRLYRHGGPSGNAEPRFQIDAWGSTIASAGAVADQVRIAMNSFTGTVAGVVVNHATCVNEIDLSEPETAVKHIALDFEVRHAEAVI